MTVHLRNPGYPATDTEPVACGDPAGRYSPDPGQVTCFICRKTPVFQAVQLGVGAPTPTEDIPTLLRAVLRDIVLPALNEDSMDAEHEALSEIADLLGIQYDDSTEQYTLTK